MDSVFNNPNYLAKGFNPPLEEIIHRDIEKKKLDEHLSWAIQGHVPNNLGIYGKTGIGKTLLVKILTNELETQAGKKAIPLRVWHLNCETYSTDTKLIRALNFLIQDDLGIPENKCMNSFGDYYHIFVTLLKKFNGICIIVLDEIDKLNNPNIINMLARMVENGDTEKNVCIIGITNNINFYDTLDPRTKSALGYRQLVFQPYNAIQLCDILNQRSKNAFHPGTLDEDVIPLCAAYAAQESGDARRAIDLLKASGELADKNREHTVTVSHVKEARHMLESGLMNELVLGLPRQSRLVLASCAYESLSSKSQVLTGSLYSSYKFISNTLGFECFTQRRMTDLIMELNMMGIVSTTILSRGRLGRSKDITLNINAEYLWNLMTQTEGLAELKNINYKKREHW